MSAYVVEELELGEVAPETVSVVRMPRTRFLTLVDDELQEAAANWADARTAEAMRERLWPIAETVPRFAMNGWISRRGCGCLVGEYLICGLGHDREELVESADATRVDGGVTWRVRDMLKAGGSDGLPQALIDFGRKIDARLCREIHKGGIEAYEVGAVVFEDEEGQA